ncbi:MAG: ABC transporter substrate-binding protein [Bacillota bacterium]|nr:ABC transporter substrate-binding protein [Bacillota bacterium]
MRGRAGRTYRRSGRRLGRIAVFGGLLVLLLGLAAGLFVAWRWPAELGRMRQAVTARLARLLPGRGGAEAGVYVEGLRDEPRGLNPLLYVDPASRHVASLLFVGLTRVDSAGRAQPGLAVSWESTAGNRVWTFKMRTGATWHDGQPITARDVTFTIGALAAIDFPGPVSGEWQGHRATLSGEDTVVITLPAPAPDFPVRAAVPVLPRHILSTVPYYDWYRAPFNQRPVGSGPFRFGEWRAGDELSLVAYPGYFLGAPGLPGITFRFVGAGGAGAGAAPPVEPPAYGYAAELFGLRAADFAGGAGGRRPQGGLVLPGAVSETERRQRDLTVRRFADLTFAALLPNHRRPALEPAVRAAINLAIDPAALMAAAARENGIQGQLWQGPDRQAGPYAYAGGPFLPGTPAADGQPATYRRDAAAARQFLAQAGWADSNADGIVEKGGRVLELALVLPADRPDLAAAAGEAARQAREAGIRVMLQPLGVGEYLARWGPPFDFDLLLLEWVTLTPGDVYELFHSSQVPVRGAAGELRGGANVAGVADTTLDSMLAEFRALPAADEVGRATLHRTINERLTSLSAWIWLWRETAYYAHPRNLEGPGPGPWGLYWNVHEWRWR